MGRTFQSGIISRLVTGGGIYAVLHNETQIDVDNSNGLPTTIKLQPIDPSLGQCTVYINDYGNNSSVGNITIVASGGNLINGQPTLILDTDGIGAEISVSDQKNFIASLNNDSQSSGIIGANNGLNVFGSNVRLGGNLIMPTSIVADNTNSFAIQDAYGSMLKTRDSNGNWCLANYGDTFLNSNQYINDYVSVGNIYDNTLILVNFGGAKNFTNATDTWTFGDYGNFNQASITFSLGRANDFYNTSNISVFGNYNYTDNCSDVTILGSNNTINSESNKFYLGNNNLNIVVDSVLGAITDEIGILLRPRRNGDGNVLFAEYGNINFGNSTYIIDSYSSNNNYSDSYIVLNFGSVCNYNNAVDVFNMGSYCNFTNSNVIYQLGRSSTFTDCNVVTNIGNSNTIDNSAVLYLLGESNIIDAVSNSITVGLYNNISNVYSSFAFGDNSQVVDSGAVYILGNGVVNSSISATIVGSATITNSQTIYSFGGNTLENVSESMVLGFYNNFMNINTYNRNVFMGFSNNGVKISEQTMEFGLFPNSPLMLLNTTNNYIQMDLPSSPLGLPVNSLYRVGNDVKIV